MTTMTSPIDSQPPTGAELDDVTLRELRAEFPDLHISTDFYGRFRAWVARGQNGHPWLVMSTDTDRFRRAQR
jgi:hypothetical protein